MPFILFELRFTFHHSESVTACLTSVLIMQTYCIMFQCLERTTASKIPKRQYLVWNVPEEGGARGNMPFNSEAVAVGGNKPNKGFQWEGGFMA